jgi:hypothetical protein
LCQAILKTTHLERRRLSGLNARDRACQCDQFPHHHHYVEQIAFACAAAPASVSRDRFDERDPSVLGNIRCWIAISNVEETQIRYWVFIRSSLRCLLHHRLQQSPHTGSRCYRRFLPRRLLPPTVPPPVVAFSASSLRIPRPAPTPQRRVEEAVVSTSSSRGSCRGERFPFSVTDDRLGTRRRSGLKLITTARSLLLCGGSRRRRRPKSITSCSPSLSTAAAGTLSTATMAHPTVGRRWTRSTEARLQGEWVARVLLHL